MDGITETTHTTKIIPMSKRRTTPIGLRFYCGRCGKRKWDKRVPVGLMFNKICYCKK
jgi:hypothetical protein